MEGGALLEDWWIKFAGDVVPYLNVTSRLDTTPDDGMLQKKGGGGFPYVIFMDQSGAVLSDGFFPSDLESVTAAKDTAMANLKELDVYRATIKANPKDRAAQGSLRIALALRHGAAVSAKEFEAIAKLKGVPADLVARYRVHLVASQLSDLEAKAGKAATSRETFMAVFVPSVFELFKSGARLPADHDSAQTLYGVTVEHAIAIKDIDIAEQAFKLWEEALLLIADANPSVALRVKKSIKKQRSELDEILTPVDSK